MELGFLIKQKPNKQTNENLNLIIKNTVKMRNYIEIEKN